jgi:hypothetical protein
MLDGFRNLDLTQALLQAGGSISFSGGTFENYLSRIISGRGFNIYGQNYKEFERPYTGNFVGILDEKAQSVDPTTLTLSDIEFYRSLSPESGTIHSDVNSEEIRLNLGDVGQMNGVAYIGNTFLFKMDHDGRKLN